MAAATGIIDEDIRTRAMNIVGYFLVAGFFFPIWMQGFGVSKPVFINIEGLGKGNLLTTIDLLLPLFAGIAILWAGKRLENILRPVILLSAGLLPVLLSFVNSKALLSSSLSRYNPNASLSLFLMLALIGVYVGSRLVSTTDHIAGRLIGGISGIVFMVLVLLPLGQGSKPIFFALFDLFKAGNISGAFSVLGVALVGIFLCYIYASLIAALNLSAKPSSEQTAANAYKLVYYATIALPVSLLVILMFSGAGLMILITAIIKMTLLLGGIIGAIAIGLWDLVDQFMPKTFKGSDLMEKPQPVDERPPNIWKG